MDVLDLAALVMGLVLEVFRPAVQRWLVAHNDGGASWDGQLDANVEVAAVVAVPMGDLNEHAAPDDAGIKVLQPRDAFADVVFESGGVLESPKSDLGRDKCHGVLLYTR